MSEAISNLPPTEERARSRYKWVTLGAVSVGTFMMTIDATIVAISLPELAVALHADASTVLWVTGAYLLTSIGLLLAMGRLSDRLGRKRLFTVGLLLFTVALGLSAAAQDIAQLISFRVLTAVGGAMVVSTSVALITHAFPSEERGRAMGIQSLVVSAGLAAGPLVGGALIDLLGWRSVFYLRVPVGAAGVAAGWLFLRETVEQKKGEPFDLWGALAIFAALVTLVLALGQGPRLGLTSAAFLALVCSGLLMLLLFVVLERRAPEPVFDLAMFGNRLYSSAMASMLLYFAAVSAAYFLVPFFLIQGRGHSATIGGLLLALIPLSMLAVSPLAGMVSDRVGSRWPTTLGLMVSAGSLFAIATLNGSTPLAIVVIALMANGVGSGMFEAPNNSAIMGTASQERLGVTAASLAVSRQVGLSVGIALGGAIFSSRQAHYQLTHSSAGALVQGFHDAVLVMAALALAGIVVTAMRGRG